MQKRMMGNEIILQVFSEKWTTKTNHWVAQEDKQGYCESHRDLSSVDYEGQCEKVFSGLTF